MCECHIAVLKLSCSSMLTEATAMPGLLLYVFPMLLEGYTLDFYALVCLSHAFIIPFMCWSSSHDALVCHSHALLCICYALIWFSGVIFLLLSILLLL